MFIQENDKIYNAIALCKICMFVMFIVDGEWEEKTGDVMWDLTHFVNNDMKTFTAKVSAVVVVVFLLYVQINSHGHVRTVTIH